MHCIRPASRDKRKRRASGGACGGAPRKAMQETPACAGDTVSFVSDAPSPPGVTPDRASGLGAHL